ncbi:CoA-substrate-specific enzyme activase, putative [Desulfatibacillum alkenivorans DSM 16219]|jgi:predicted CoA-substrate-specific enzyme activase|uniref:CoA-substrate-specific enzyme activase, putative n=1 Tax=Desulfatibacillum alkenivorans DSM 16219 TaxID=1121393 RepID=A0A1M6FE66_9BACT|nr:acyl-CoA dehydratase activase [Desulfatibacillum alkenivorans]SHI95981.1 CoA-substrate-specific enzyme activase, putative [Desulfatibacillum alkenivorans DSM 16219]
MITAGVDIGTRFAKICIVDEGKIVSFAESGVDRKISLLMRDLFSQALKEAGISKREVAKTSLTGYGAGLVKIRGRIFSEPRCIAAAIKGEACQTRTVADVGGIFIHAAVVENRGRIKNFASNEKCAAGGGKFLEMVCKALGKGIADLSPCAAKAKAPYSITSNCAVFAESEIVSQVNAGAHPNDILAGAVNLIASRAATLIERVGLGGDVVLTGGVPRIPAFQKALESRLEKQTILPDFAPQLAAAYGAALLASE